jgi:Phosphotyrosine interaction domain (PTB/PID)
VKLHMLSVPFRFNLFGLKFWNKRSLSITESDPVCKVIYLGNVLTPLAKGEACVEKPLSTLWNNYCANVKHDIDMKLTICNSGLKALTKEHGLTEYWANRITYCVAHPSHPKVFCWVYRHDGRKMKPELRCHAVLCASKDKASRMAQLLTTKLTVALQDFRREKKIRQNARLSLVEIPIRKQLLVKGLANFKAPLERSKSAPKLTSIVEENKDENEDQDEDDEDQESDDASELIEEYESMKM